MNNTNRGRARRAILSRQFRRGYVAAVDTLIDAVAGKISPKNFGRLKGWQRIVLAWHEQQSAAQLMASEVESPPKPRFK